MKRIPLSGKHGQGLFLVVDDQDYETLTAHGRWWCKPRTRRDGTVVRYAWTHAHDANGQRTYTLAHKLLTGFDLTDHANGDGLDNRRENMRDGSASQNQANRDGHGKSPFHGVDYHVSANGRPWRVTLRKDGRQYFGGHYATEEEAARAYDERAIELHGEFARLNFPPATPVRGVA